MPLLSLSLSNHELCCIIMQAVEKEVNEAKKKHLGDHIEKIKVSVKEKICYHNRIMECNRDFLVALFKELNDLNLNLIENMENANNGKANIYEFVDAKFMKVGETEIDQGVKNLFFDVQTMSYDQLCCKATLCIRREVVKGKEKFIKFCHEKKAELLRKMIDNMNDMLIRQVRMVQEIEYLGQIFEDEMVSESNLENLDIELDVIGHNITTTYRGYDEFDPYPMATD